MTELDENYIIQEFNKSNEDFRIFKKDNIIFLQSIKRNDWLPFSINFSSNNFIRRKNQANSQDIIKAIDKVRISCHNIFKEQNYVHHSLLRLRDYVCYKFRAWHLCKH